MPLINKRLLQKTLNENHHQLMSSQKILDHLKTKVYDRIQAKTFKKEEAEKPVILPKLFELLGYSHPENFEFEFTNQSRSADITLGVEFEDVRQPEVMIEWKGIDTTSLDKGKAGETPVSQMSDYMSKTNANFGIVSNFREFRLYSKQKGQTEFYQVYLEDIINDTNKLEEFVFLFRKTTLLKGENKQSLLETLINQSEAEQEQITKDFYNDYKQIRLNLFQHLVKNNPVEEAPGFHNIVEGLITHNAQNGQVNIAPTVHKIFLLEKSQKILDRLIFIMFCEDGFLLPNNILKDTHTLAKNSRSRSETKIWEEVKYLFEDIDKGRYDVNPQINAFNGGLFAEDVELNSLIIKDEIWVDLIKLAEYDFESDLNVNILGHIFEQSISDIEELKSEIERNSPLDGWQTKSDGVDLKSKTSKRKKDGIYYTPEYITDYIVSETIGNWLEDKQKEIPFLRGGNEVDGVFPLNQIKILDPAGGSGAFPNQVHNYLTKKHEAKFKELSTDENDLFNQVQIDKSILQNNIFMVDLQPESVEIAKLSLWLKTAKKDQKLNNLDENVKVGNSLTTPWINFFPNAYCYKEVSEFVYNFSNRYKITEKQALEVFSKFIERMGILVPLYFGEYKKLNNKIKINQEDAKKIQQSHITSAILTELRPFILRETLLKKLDDIIQRQTNVPLEVKDRSRGFYKQFLESLNDWKNTGFSKIGEDGKENFHSFYDVYINGYQYHQDDAKRVINTDDKFETDFFILKNISYLNNTLARLIRYYINIFALPGFDVILGNPPYIKEYTNKSAFNGLHDNPYYQGKMDLWTMFACQAIDNLKWGGYLSFIAPNNWISNAGASILRDKILSDGELQTFIDFGDFKVFEDAGIQTMVFVFKKRTPRNKYMVNYARVEDKNTSLENIKLLLSSKLTADIDGIIKFQAEIEPEKIKLKGSNNLEFSKEDELKLNIDLANSLTTNNPYSNKGELKSNIPFVNKTVDQILEKMEVKREFILKENEVGQGIVAAPDKCFLVDKIDVFTSQERNYLKPYFTASSRYETAETSNYIFYISNKNFKSGNLDNYPNIKAHFEPNKDILTEAKIKYETPNKPYFFLHREREERFFEKGEKIVCAIRSEKPSFYYTESEYYGSRALNFIKTDRINLKYLTAILNSNIVYFWLRHKGKLLGDLLQIDKAPLLNIPIPQATEAEQTQITELVDQIINLKKETQDYLKNTFILLQAELGGQKITLNKKLEKFWTLDFAEFLTELTKQKIQISHPQKRNLITSFETDKKKILELEQQVEKVDGEIEGLVRELYGLNNQT